MYPNVTLIFNGIVSRSKEEGNHLVPLWILCAVFFTVRLMLLDGPLHHLTHGNSREDQDYKSVEISIRFQTKAVLQTYSWDRRS